MASGESRIGEQSSGWHRLWARLSAFAEAMEMSEAEFLSRRISALEAEVAVLKRPQSEK